MLLLSSGKAVTKLFTLPKHFTMLIPSGAIIAIAAYVLQSAALSTFEEFSR